MIAGAQQSNLIHKDHEDERPVLAGISFEFVPLQGLILYYQEAEEMTTKAFAVMTDKDVEARASVYLRIKNLEAPVIDIPHPMTVGDLKRRSKKSSEPVTLCLEYVDSVQEILVHDEDVKGKLFAFKTSMALRENRMGFHLYQVHPLLF